MLRDIIDRSKRIVCFTGAGVSTASGIPDFRGAEGLFSEEWGGLTPEMILSASFFYLHPERFFEFYRARMLYPDAKPNAAHMALYDLERAGKLRGVVTQNIDGLHKRAGNRLVYEIHGSVWEDYCMDAYEFKFATPNLRAWHMGCPRTPQGTFDRLRQLKADLDKAVEEEKQRMKQ